MIGDIYNWLWYHVSALFCESKELRRPFTYWMRDMQVRYPYLFWTVTIGVFYLMFLVCQWNLIVGFFASGFTWMLLGHVFWGTKYVPDQQEDPPYIHE